MIYTAREHGGQVRVYAVDRNRPYNIPEGLAVQEDGQITNAFEADTDRCTLTFYVVDKNGRLKTDKWVRDDQGRHVRQLLTSVAKMSYDVVDRATNQVIDRARL